MNWIKKRKLLAIEAIKHNDCSCLEIKDIWKAIHESFNLAQHQQVDVSLLEEIPNNFPTEWTPFSKEEFLSSICNCSNYLTPESDRLSWKHFKEIIKNSSCFNSIINIANAYIDLGHWPSHFKMSTSIIIPKPNKASYNTSKLFRPIVLLNTLGKLIEKVIGKRLQFQALSKNIIHSCQLGRLKQ